MNKKQKEALVLALAEKGKTYREITKEAGVSPNTIKAVLNKAGIDESTSISSRAFELYVQQKTPVQVAIALNLEAKEAIRYHQEYFMLLGCTEFTKVYLQIKDNPWPYVNLVQITQNARMSDCEVMELLKISNGYPPRVRLEYDRLKAEINSLEAEKCNSVRIYQQFVDRDIELKRREDELQLSISDLEDKQTQLHKTTLHEPIPELQENNDINLEIKEEEVLSMIDVLTQQPNMTINYHQNENETLHYHPQVEPSTSRTLIFDTKDLF
ncbi:MAG: hypothetical protein ACRD5B_12385 [Nitrososphaeraceae archaeon]